MVGVGAAIVKRPTVVKVDESHVYWWERDDAKLMRKVVGGTEPETLYNASDSSDGYIALDDTHVYWINRNEKTLFRLAK
jgi:hypothetical protein